MYIYIYTYMYITIFGIKVHLGVRYLQSPLRKHGATPTSSSCQDGGIQTTTKTWRFEILQGFGHRWWRFRPPVGIQSDTTGPRWYIYIYPNNGFPFRTKENLFYLSWIVVDLNGVGKIYHAFDPVRWFVSTILVKLVVTGWWPGFQEVPRSNNFLRGSKSNPNHRAPN